MTYIILYRLLGIDTLYVIIYLLNFLYYYSFIESLIPSSIWLYLLIIKILSLLFVLNTIDLFYIENGIIRMLEFFSTDYYANP